MTTTKTTTTNTPPRDRIIKSLLEQAREYDHKAGVATDDAVRQGYITARDKNLALVRERLDAYGIAEVPQSVLDRLMQASGDTRSQARPPTTTRVRGGKRW